MVIQSVSFARRISKIHFDRVTLIIDILVSTYNGCASNRAWLADENPFDQKNNGNAKFNPYDIIPKSGHHCSMLS